MKTLTPSSPVVLAEDPAWAADSRLSAWFWGAYGWCYDAIADLTPYRELLAEVAGEVPRDAAAILDVGCGTGNVLAALQQAHPGARLTGVDFSVPMLRRAGAKVPLARLAAVNLDRSLPFPDASFDAITCVNVIYAVAEPARTLAELRRVLKPGGVIVVTSPAAGFNMMAILRAHLRHAGLMRNIPLILRLIAVGAFNVMILRKARQGTYHFFHRTVAAVLVGGTVKPAYAGQNWLATMMPRA